MSLNVCSQFGAHGNALVAPEGSVYACAGCATLHADGPIWGQNDVGKQIAVEGAGAAVVGHWEVPYTLPHRATVVAVAADGKSLTMSAPAATAVNPSPRVVWGHDDTAAIQAALDAAAEGTDKTVIFPSGAGAFLVNQVTLNGSASAGGRDYSGIILLGQGPDRTSLEAFDPHYNVGGVWRGVLCVGDIDWRPERPDDRRVEGLSVTGIEFRAARNALLPAKSVYLSAAEGVVFRHCRFVNPSYEALYPGGGEFTRFLVVEDCEALDSGRGGPAYSGTTSGFNLNSSDVSATRCVARGCGQGFEIGGRRVSVQNSEAHAPPGNPQVIAFQVGSTGSGVDDVSVRHCRTYDCDVALVAANGIGTLARVTFERNIVRNGQVVFGGAENANTVLMYASPRPASHGPHVVRDNLFEFTTERDLTAVLCAVEGGRPHWGYFDLAVEENTLRYAGQACYRKPALVLTGPVGGHTGLGGNVRWSRNRIEGAPGPALAPAADVAVYSYRVDGSYGDRAFRDAGDNDYGGRPGVVAVYT